jgi:hypothetical protein
LLSSGSRLGFPRLTAALLQVVQFMGTNEGEDSVGVLAKYLDAVQPILTMGTLTDSREAQDGATWAYTLNAQGKRLTLGLDGLGMLTLAHYHDASKAAPTSAASGSVSSEPMGNTGTAGSITAADAAASAANDAVSSSVSNATNGKAPSSSPGGARKK